MRVCSEESGAHFQSVSRGLKVCPERAGGNGLKVSPALSPTHALPPCTLVLELGYTLRPPGTAPRGTLSGWLTQFNTHARHCTRAAEEVGENGVICDGGPIWNRARIDAQIAADGLSSYPIQGDGNCMMRFDCARVPHSVGPRKENRWRGSVCVRTCSRVCE